MVGTMPNNISLIAKFILSSPSLKIFGIWATTKLRPTKTTVRQNIIRAEEAYIDLLRRVEISEDWFTPNVRHLADHLSRIKREFDEIKILEIGSFEGLSGAFLSSYLEADSMTCIDTWSGPEYSEFAPEINWEEVERKFDQNWSESCVEKIKMESSIALGALANENREFNLIYIDGSHFSLDVMADGLLAWKLLSGGGIMVFDDYLWFGYARPRDNVSFAVNTLIKMLGANCSILFVGRQVILKKRALTI